MLRHSSVFVLVLLLLHVGLASAQESHYPVMEKIAQKVVQKYQTSSCQDLARQKSQPPTGKQAQMEQRALRRCATIPRCVQSSSTAWRLPLRTNCSIAA